MSSLGPPLSDDDYDDYDGFSFGCEFDEASQDKNWFRYSWQSDRIMEDAQCGRIAYAISVGKIDLMEYELKESNGGRLDYNESLNDGWTPLMHAVAELRFDVVTYLINKGVDVDYDSSMCTPLMLVCSKFSIKRKEAPRMAKLLIEHGASVNVRNPIGLTPLMLACTTGNKDTVAVIIDLAAIDVTDNLSKTALHYAIESRNFDIVEMLLNAGADIEICDGNGQKPRDLAISLGLKEIESLFPEEIVDFLPTSAEQYESFQDIAPTIFPGREMAAYSQDIPRMLRGMRMENCAKTIHEANISLAEFLTIDDASLQSHGVAFEYQRKRILLGLLRFHAHQFSPKSIELVVKKKQKNMYEYFELYACYLKHLVMMESAVVYLKNIGALKVVSKESIDEVIALTNDIQNELLSLQKCVQQASINSTKNPLFIGPNTHQGKKYKKILRPFVTYTMIIGIGIFLSCKLIKLMR